MNRMNRERNLNKAMTSSKHHNNPIIVAVNQAPLVELPEWLLVLPVNPTI